MQSCSIGRRNTGTPCLKAFATLFAAQVAMSIPCQLLLSPNGAIISMFLLCSTVFSWFGCKSVKISLKKKKQFAPVHALAASRILRIHDRRVRMKPELYTHREGLRKKQFVIHFLCRCVSECSIEEPMQFLCHCSRNTKCSFKSVSHAWRQNRDAKYGTLLNLALETTVFHLRTRDQPPQTGARCPGRLDEILFR